MPVLRIYVERIFLEVFVILLSLSICVYHLYALKLSDQSQPSVYVCDTCIVYKYSTYVIVEYETGHQEFLKFHKF